VAQERLAEGHEPADAGRRGEARLQHVVYENPAGRLDRRERQLLLGAEVREESALADPQPGGECTEREPFQPVDRSHLGGGPQDRLTASLAVRASAALRSRGRARATCHLLRRHGVSGLNPAGTI
jgi:hypothetical protein